MFCMQTIFVSGVILFLRQETTPLRKQKKKENKCSFNRVCFLVLTPAVSSEAG